MRANVLVEAGQSLTLGQSAAALSGPVLESSKDDDSATSPSVLSYCHVTHLMIHFLMSILNV